MFFSLIIAFVVTPWAAIRVLRWRKGEARLESHGPAAPESAVPSRSQFAHEEDFFTRLYRRVMDPLLGQTRWRWIFLVVISALLLAAMSTVGFGWVKVKMLPFDNKSEFQVILNMPEGSSLERTAQAAREMAAAIREEPEVTDYQIFVGTASPFNFNGLVRHYFLRRGAHIADLQINLVNNHDRKAQLRNPGDRPLIHRLPPPPLALPRGFVI